MNNVAELSLEEIHNATLDIMKFIHEFCHSNNLVYYLAYGTLLGCIRHNGFIPWDDDVDIWMKRHDYNKLIKLFNNKGNTIGNFKLCSRDSTDRYEFSIIRISDMRYKCIQTNTSVFPDLGTFIDIYPLDNIENQHEFDSTFDQIKQLNVTYSIYNNWKSNSFVKSIGKLAISCFLKIKYGSKYLEYVNKKTNSALCRFDNSAKYYGVLIWFTTAQKVYPKNLFKSAESHVFESYHFDIPSGYNELLTLIYGNYMTPPPENKRTQYHQYRIVRRSNI